MLTKNTTVHNPRNPTNINRIPKPTDTQQHSKTLENEPHNTPTRPGTPGAGAGLLDRLLTEAGIPESTLALSRRLIPGGNTTAAATMSS